VNARGLEARRGCRSGARCAICPPPDSVAFVDLCSQTRWKGSAHLIEIAGTSPASPRRTIHDDHTRSAAGYHGQRRRQRVQKLSRPLGRGRKSFRRPITEHALTIRRGTYSRPAGSMVMTRAASDRSGQPACDSATLRFMVLRLTPLPGREESRQSKARLR
jgi:hypothetical protein